MARCNHYHRGESHYAASVSEDDARLIKLLIKDGLDRRVIAEKMETTIHVVNHIGAGSTWRHIKV